MEKTTEESMKSISSKRPVPNLSFQEVLVAARKAFNEGSLAAQRGHTGCLLHYEDGSTCPVGAVFQNVDKKFNKSSVMQLLKSGAIESSEAECAMMRVMQELHDCWTDGNTYSGSQHPLPETQWAKEWVQQNWNEYATPELFEDFLKTAEHNLSLENSQEFTQAPETNTLQV